MENKKVFVILVNYNNCNDTVECITSISRCSYVNNEICVVDNASTDDSFIRLEERYKNRNDVHLINLGRNIGFAGGCNLGITYALKHGAEYILLLNNDTLVEHYFLTELVECSKKYVDKAAVGAKIYYEKARDIIWYAGGEFNFRTARSKHYGIDEIDKGKYDEEKEVSFITGCCILLHKNIIEKTGLMPEEYFLYCEDLAYSIELKNAGFKLIYNPRAVIYHKVSASTGKDSDISVYYSIRNKLFIIKQYLDMPWRILAQIVFLMESLKRTIWRRYKLKIVLASYRDFYKKLKGKRFSEA